ncbi:DsbA family protein [Rivibacter subsaxonicus]|uniref:DSBA-like thioredoxin domain-containing protein n=1 Tax=Rivibacter subsaxonicus TaxID=457575 RepID=A0A4V2FU56_9BURK|nr:DsbA family protein [Rivibacter subsaxonicus]RZU00736.1 putative protein-disulfide isomerase [Rivibacter subsaxonicus]
MDTLIYLYDPLCGWCYGAGAALAGLEGEEWAVRPLPTGLFAGDPRRRLDPAMEAHIWQADQRIAHLSGQPFSEAYRERVLRNPAMPFDSGPATAALTAVAERAPSRERAALAAIQRARWVDGRDIADAAVLAEALAGEFGAAGLADAALAARSRERIARGQRLMREFGFGGVPALIALRGADPALDEPALVERAVRDGEPIAGNALFDGSLAASLNAARAA